MGSWLEDWDKIVEESKKYTKSGTLKKTTEPNKGLTEEQKTLKRLETQSFNNESFNTFNKDGQVVKMGVDEDGDGIADIDPITEEIKNRLYAGSPQATLDSLNMMDKFPEYTPTDPKVRPKVVIKLLKISENLNKSINEYYQKKLNGEVKLENGEPVLKENITPEQQIALDGLLDMAQKNREKLGRVFGSQNQEKPKVIVPGDETNEINESNNKEEPNNQGTKREVFSDVKPSGIFAKSPKKEANLKIKATIRDFNVRVGEGGNNRDVFSDGFKKAKEEGKKPTSLNAYKKTVIKEFFENIPWVDADGNKRVGFNFDRNGNIEVTHKDEYEEVMRLLTEASENKPVPDKVQRNSNGDIIQRAVFKGPFLTQWNDDNWEIVEGGDKPKGKVE